MEGRAWPHSGPSPSELSEPPAESASKEDSSGTWVVTSESVSGLRPAQCTTSVPSSASCGATEAPDARKRRSKASRVWSLPGTGTVKEHSPSSQLPLLRSMTNSCTEASTSSPLQYSAMRPSGLRTNLSKSPSVSRSSTDVEPFLRTVCTSLSSSSMASPVRASARAAFRTLGGHIGLLSSRSLPRKRRLTQPDGGPAPLSSL
mmetsp:Transcript_62983/g.177646  ORF Transcript_62983/g.177646 Transcript_62983/m.177646 type:complete len:203 (+) Transcript_62983:1416-2024(+)